MPWESWGKPTQTREAAVGSGHLVTLMGEGVESEEWEGCTSVGWGVTRDEEAENELCALSQRLATKVAYLSSKESSDRAPRRSQVTMPQSTVGRTSGEPQSVVSVVSPALFGHRQAHLLRRVPWTTRRSNQSILKEINPNYSLEGLMLKLQYLIHLT